MVTRNGYRFGVGVFVICVTMFLAGHLSLALTGNGKDVSRGLTGPGGGAIELGGN